MAQNITLLGASYSDVPAVTLPKTGGGTARFDDCSVVTASASDVASGKIFIASDGTITTGTYSGGGGGGGDYPWFGPNTVKDYTKTITINLANDTSWDSWTASTTASSILAAPTTNDFTYSYNRNTDVVSIVTTVVTNYVLESTATKKTIPISTGRVDLYINYGVPNTYSQFKDLTVGAQTYATNSLRRIYYYNSNGIKSVGTAEYGAYHYGAPTFTSSASGSTATISAKRNAIYARCNNAYLPTARKNDIDAENTNIVITFDVYKTPRENAFMPHIFNDMLTAMNAAPEA